MNVQPSVAWHASAAQCGAASTLLLGRRRGALETECFKRAGFRANAYSAAHRNATPKRHWCAVCEPSAVWMRERRLAKVRQTGIVQHL
jgi:hypothetical protein